MVRMERSRSAWWVGAPTRCSTGRTNGEHLLGHSRAVGGVEYRDMEQPEERVELGCGEELPREHCREPSGALRYIIGAPGAISKAVCTYKRERDRVLFFNEICRSWGEILDLRKKCWICVCFPFLRIPERDLLKSEICPLLF